MIENLSKTNHTLLNGQNLIKPVHLHAGDVITVVERKFRFESTAPVPATRTPLKPSASKQASATKKSS